MAHGEHREKMERQTGRNRPAARAQRAGLTREAIVKEALRIVDSEGLKALSMRRLGAELEVDPMAVYYHIPNKSALLDALVEAVMDEIDVSIDDPSRSVEERLVAAAHAYREALLAHPNAISVVVVRPLRTPASLRPVEVLLSILRDAGFAPTDAMAAVDIFALFVRGAVVRDACEMTDADLCQHEEASIEMLLQVLNPEEFPVLLQMTSSAEFIGMEAEFDRGIRALIRGLLQEFATINEEE